MTLREPAIGARIMPPGIDILPGTDVEGEWERFEIFEALHNSMRICNPLTEQQFASIVDLLAPADGSLMLDVACGYGELLLQCADRAAINGVGVDLSPWMVSVAAARDEQRQPRGPRLRWVLGEARDFGTDSQWDVVACMGAEWVWHGFNGTVRALAQRVQPGGRVVIGAARLKDGCDPAAVSKSHGRLETVGEKEAMLAAYGLVPVARIDPDDAAWDAYLGRTKTSIDRWVAAMPGGRSDEYVEAQQEWLQARERDREIIAWSAWVARRIGPR